MPAYQWVVLKTKTSEYFKDISPVSVTNREYPSLKSPIWDSKNSVLKNATSWQLTQAEGSKLYYCSALSTDSLIITKITKEVSKESLEDKYLGYKYLPDDSLLITNYAFNYFNPYTMNRYIAQVDGDTTMNALQDTPTFFELVPTNDNKSVAYGYSDANGLKRAGIVQLERAIYQIKSGDSHIALGKENRYVLTESAVIAPAEFYFKENNETAGKGCYYAFIDAIDVNKDKKDNVISFNNKLGVADQSLKALLQEQVIEEVRTSAFTIAIADQPLYRRFNSEKLDGAMGNQDDTLLLRFKEHYVGDFLMDETNENFQREGMNYLGIGAEEIAKAGLSFTVRPFNIGKSARYNIKPQYLVYVNETEKAGTKLIPCDYNHKHLTVDGKPTNNPDSCFHATPAVPGFIRYNLLVSFADSTEAPNTPNDEQLYHFGMYHRVGFVDAVEQDSVLYILGDNFKGIATADLNMEEVKEVADAIDLKKAVTEDKHHNYTWSFRYIDPTIAANEEEADRAFLIESNKSTTQGNKLDIAPNYGAWLKNQNNCLVLSDPDQSTFENAKTGDDNALIFNIEKGSADDMATDNEEIAASSVTVIAGAGQITINGAAGKKVVVSNILGQVVANTVLTSDNATIAAPQGVVVVAVEGEEAVKAIVK